MGVSVTALEAGPIASEMSENFKDTMHFETVGMQYISTEQCVEEALRAFTDENARITSA